MKSRSAGLLLLAAAAAACGRVDFQQARHLEDTGQFARALKAYENFLARGPSGPQEIEAAVRAARIYAQVFNRCDRAVPLFERAARRSPDGQAPGATGSQGPRGRAVLLSREARRWVELAHEGLLNCPDFFPISPGARWVLVDAETGGKNMRLEIAVSTAAGKARVVGAYYAGTNRFMNYSRACEKKDWMTWENGAPILRYPYRQGSSWSAKVRGKRTDYRIEDVSASLNTKAGAFEGCLKVRAHIEGEPSWVFDYYCPHVGRVKTTLGAPEGENPNTELSEFSIPFSSPHD
ncbi:MAG: tetratricopeptide repeat protein [Elusimicrobia bacterium]|nr:tetratricopeptide repeat protein [Elusimicrobiota bacterium]